MRFFQTLFAAAAFVAAAAAVKPEIHDFPKNVVPGKTYEITYSPADDTPTTFNLRRGDDLNLDKVAVLTTTATKGKFSWTVDKNLPNRNDYALEIIQGAATNNNYIGKITLTGSTATDLPSSSSVPPTSTGASSGKPTVSSTASAPVTTTTGVSNSTVTSTSLSRTVSAPTTASTTGSGPPKSTGAAANLGSPLALVLGGFAAFAYFN